MTSGTGGIQLKPHAHLWELRALVLPATIRCSDGLCPIGAALASSAAESNSCRCTQSSDSTQNIQARACKDEP